MSKCELKPCPFCGGEATIKKVGHGYTSGVFTETYNVGCDNCKIYFKGESEFCVRNGEPIIAYDGYKNCIEIWNRRAKI